MLKFEKKQFDSFFIKILLYISFLFLLLSQLDKNYLSLFKNLGIFSLVITFFFTIKKNGKIYLNDVCKNVILLTIFFISMCIFFSLISDNKYIGDMFWYLLLSIIMLVIGFQLSFILTYNDVRNFVINVGILMVIISCVVFSKNYLTVDFINETYIYSEKNSIATIMSTGIGALMLLLHNKSKLTNTLILIFIIIMFFFKSRASSLGFCLALAFLAVTKNKSKLTRKHVKYLITAFSIMFFLIFTYFDEIIGLLNIFFLNNLNLKDASLNSISGARISMIKYLNVALETNPLFGVGEVYIESFPLALLASYGILGAITLLVMLGYIFSYMYTIYKKNKDNCLYKFMMYLLVSFYTNSFFEMLSPFGPGTKCFILWFVLGLLLNAKYTRCLKNGKG